MRGREAQQRQTLASTAKGLIMCHTSPDSSTNVGVLELLNKAWRLRLEEIPDVFA